MQLSMPAIRHDVNTPGYVWGYSQVIETRGELWPVDQPARESAPVTTVATTPLGG
jgi:hypothetical protein